MACTELDKLIWMHELALAFEVVGEPLPQMTWDGGVDCLLQLHDKPIHRSTDYSHFYKHSYGLGYCPIQMGSSDIVRFGSIAELCAAAARDWKEARRDRS
jgi:hypothetical protein